MGFGDAGMPVHQRARVGGVSCRVGDSPAGSSCASPSRKVRLRTYSAIGTCHLCPTRYIGLRQPARPKESADMTVTIRTNNIPRDIIDAHELSDVERAQFDYIDW